MWEHSLKKQDGATRLKNVSDTWQQVTGSLLPHGSQGSVVHSLFFLSSFFFFEKSFISKNNKISTGLATLPNRVNPCWLFPISSCSGALWGPALPPERQWASQEAGSRETYTKGFKVIDKKASFRTEHLGFDIFSNHYLKGKWHEFCNVLKCLRILPSLDCQNAFTWNGQNIFYPF